jgi:hypothetical protein
MQFFYHFSFFHFVTITIDKPMKPVSKPEKPASLPVENRQILDVFEF